MTLYARNEHDPVEIGDTAIELFSPPDPFVLADCFAPSVAAFFHEVPAGTVAGSVWDGTNWVPAEAPPGPNLYARSEHAVLAIGDTVLELITPAVHEVPAGTVVGSAWDGAGWIAP